MKAIIKTKGFLEKLDRADRILQAMSSSERKYVVHTESKGVWLSAYSDVAFVRMNLKGDVQVDGTGKFGFEPNVLTSLFARRTEIQVAVVKSNLRFKTSGKDSGYSGEMATVPVTDQIMDTIQGRSEAATDDAKKSGISINGAAFEVLAEGVRSTLISATHKAADIVTYVSCKKNRLVIGTTDRFHAALYTSKMDVMARDFQLTVLPAYFDYFDRIRSCYTKDAPALSVETSNGGRGGKGKKPAAAKGKQAARESKDDSKAEGLVGFKAPKYSMTLAFATGGKRIGLTSPDFQITLPTVQDDKTIFDNIVNFEKQCRDSVLVDLEIEHEALQGSVDNLNSIYEYGMAIECLGLEVNGDKAKLRLKSTSNYGNVSDNVPAKQGKKASKKSLDLNLRIDPETFGDSLDRLAGDMLHLKFSSQPQAYWMQTELKYGELTHSGILIQPTKAVKDKK